MVSNLNIIEGPYLKDLLDQPVALQNTVDALEYAPFRRLHEESRRYQRIVLTGMGSSLHALYPLHLELVAAGLPSMHLETAELVHYQAELLTKRTLLVAVSQSGRSAEIVHLLDIAKERRCRLIGVTNDPMSPLAGESESLLVMHAGEESSVSCKTFVATLLVLEWLGALMLGRNLEETRAALAKSVTATEEYLAAWRRHLEAFACSLEGVGHVFVVGRGRSIAAAQTGGLILKESTHVPAEGMSSAAFRHGPFESISPQTYVMVMEGDSRTAGLNSRLAEDIRAAGGRAGLVSASAANEECRIPGSDESIRPILEILPVQMLSLALAALRGREAGRFTLGSKVTTTE